jgi:outer membrane protein assembly factor BamB
MPETPSSVTVYGSASYDDTLPPDSTLFALDGAAGKARWTNTSTTTARTLPVVVNGVFYIGASDGSVSAYQASNGNLLWTQKLRSGRGDSFSLRGRA